MEAARERPEHRVHGRPEPSGQRRFTDEDELRIPATTRICASRVAEAADREPVPARSRPFAA